MSHGGSGNSAGRGSKAQQRLTACWTAMEAYGRQSDGKLQPLLSAVGNAVLRAVGSA